MRTLELPARLLLVFTTALVALGLAAMTIRFETNRGSTASYTTHPRLEQAAGIINLLRTAAPHRWPLILRAVNGPSLDVWVTDQAPPEQTRLRRAPRIENLIRNLAAPDLGDGLRAYTDMDVPYKVVGTEGYPARIVWPMSDGRTLVLDTVPFATAAPTASLGAAPGLWIGVSGLAIAVLALVVTAWELRPLRRLAAATARFDGMPPVDIPERGAPDVRRLIRAVSDMQRRLAALLQERSFLIGAISHDLKTYLTRLRLRMETFEDNEQRARAAADLDTMTDLIDTSLAFARGTAVAEPRSLVDLADLVAVEVAERSAVGQTVTASEDDEGDAYVLGDPLALRRVIANLVDNALKFGRGQVVVSIERNAGTYRLAVDDDGPGISEPQRNAIFSPFYRVEGSRNRGTGGSGLGLTIARQIVEAHRGTIAVEQSRFGGARFVISLPSDRKQADHI